MENETSFIAYAMEHTDPQSGGMNVTALEEAASGEYTHLFLSWYLLGRALFYSGRYRVAREAFLNAVKRNPRDPLVPRAYLFLSKTCRALGYYTEAEAHGREAAALDSSLAGYGRRDASEELKEALDRFEELLSA